MLNTNLLECPSCKEWKNIFFFQVAGDNLFLFDIRFKDIQNNNWIENGGFDQSIKLTTYYFTNVALFDFVSNQPSSIVDYRGTQNAGSYAGIQFRNYPFYEVVLNVEKTNFFNLELLNGGTDTWNFPA